MGRLLIGKITSTKMTGTAVVTVTRLKEHPLYKKKYQATTRVMANNPGDKYVLGDVVEVSETRPMSKNKRWKIERKIETKTVGTKS